MGYNVGNANRKRQQPWKSSRIDFYASQLAQQCEQAGLPSPTREYQFLTDRKFRFDLAWPEYGIAVEVHGGLWIYGRHQRPYGFAKDLEKMNLAVLNGWRVLAVIPDMVRNGQALELIERLFQQIRR